MSEIIRNALAEMQAAVESGKMTAEDYFQLGVIAGRNQRASEEKED